MEVSVLNFNFIRPSTVARWTFDNEDGADSSPNGNDLTIGYPSYTLGKFGMCADFSDYKYLRTNTKYSSLELDNMSIFAWAKGGSQYQRTVFSFEYFSGTYLYGYRMGITGYKIFFVESDGDEPSSPAHVGTSTKLSDGGWHWLVATRGDDLVKLYVDGNLEYQGNRQPIYYYSTVIACIGAYWNYRDSNTIDYFNAKIDDLNILDIELSPDVIRRMYAFQMGWI